MIVRSVLIVLNSPNADNSRRPLCDSRRRSRNPEETRSSPVEPRGRTRPNPILDSPPLSHRARRPRSPSRRPRPRPRERRLSMLDVRAARALSQRSPSRPRPNGRRTESDLSRRSQRPHDPRPSATDETLRVDSVERPLSDPESHRSRSVDRDHSQNKKPLSELREPLSKTGPYYP